MTSTCMLPAVFNALPQNEKAIMVAQDVISQIKANSIRVTQGSYFSSTKDSLFFDNPDLSTASPEGREILAKAQCHVCAKGAIFMSAIQHSNKMKLDKLTGFVWNAEVSRKVCRNDKIFTQKNFNEIEAAFEKDAKFVYTRTDGNGDRAGTAEEVVRGANALAFGKRYPGNKQRLAAICMNIIKNNGVFDPTKNVPKQSDVLRAIKPYKVKAKLPKLVPA